MASPQAELGHLKIADDLVAAMIRYKFTGNHLRVLLAIMAMTYRVGKTRAQISLDDLRYATGEKRYLVEKAINELLAMEVVWRQILNQHDYVYGIQKDFEKWGAHIEKLPKTGNPITNVIANNINNSYEVGVPNTGKIATPPQRFLDYVQKELGIQFGLMIWRVEHKKSLTLYQKALELAHGPAEAMYAMKDYLAYLDDPNFRTRVSHPVSYMLPGFERWFKSLPPKDRLVRQNEDVTGRRLRYDLKTKSWIRTNDKL